MMFETTKEMPIDLYTQFTKYLVQDLGIGSDMRSAMNHLGNLFRFLKHEMIEEAGRETQNLYQNIFLSVNKINISHICFGCFVHSINGKEIEDYSESALIRLSGQLGKMGVTQGDALEILEDLKKNLMGN
jgi:hypothetical protein